MTFHTPHLSVTEGNDAIVCVQLIGLNDSTQLGCDIAVTLTLITGIAGIYTCMLHLNVQLGWLMNRLYIQMLKLARFYNLVDQLAVLSQPDAQLSPFSCIYRSIISGTGPLCRSVEIA